MKAKPFPRLRTASEISDYLTKEDKLINCPFCNEGNFDKIGLKHHLNNYCEEYNNTLSI